MSNSDLKNFAVFINSKSASNPTTKKSQVSIPFVGNLANHDSMTVFRMSFVDMLFTNNFYNIRENFNTLKVLVTYAAGRGKPASYEVKTITVPPGFYDYDSLSSFFNGAGVCGWTIDNQSITYAQGVGGTTIFDVYSGFGSIPTATPTQTNGSDATSAQPQIGRIIFQSATLGLMEQPGTDINSPIASSTPTMAHSYVYSGVYLIVDPTTAGLTKTLGFFEAIAVPPAIPDTPFFGYGFPIYSKTLNPESTTFPYQNTTVFGLKDSTTGQVVYPVGTTAYDDLFTSLIPACMTDLTGLDEMYVRCPQMRTQFQASTSKSKLAPTDVIAVIPLNVPFGAKMSWVPQFQLSSLLLNTNITQLDFTLTNSNGELLDFQGANWSITFFCSEEEDESRVQFENQGTLATPLQLQNSFTSGSAYMQERVNRKRGKFTSA